MTEIMNLESWNQNNSIQTSVLDDAVKKLIELENDYDAKKKVSNEANEKWENQRSLVLEMLKQSGKSKYHVDGVGTVSMAIKTQVSAPKDPVNKRAMLDYFMSLEDGLYVAYLTVNHQTLNSYINQQAEIEPGFVLPGVGEKKETPELRFRKEKP